MKKQGVSISLLYISGLRSAEFVVLFGPLAKALALRSRVPGFDSQTRQFCCIPSSDTVQCSLFTSHHLLGWVRTVPYRSRPCGPKIRAGQISTDTDHWSLASLEFESMLKFGNSRIHPKAKCCVTLIGIASRECNTNSIYKALRWVQVGSLHYVSIILYNNGEPISSASES